MRDFKTALSRQIGEHRVIAELGRRGIVAAPLTAGMPEVDILAYRSGRALPIQVKAIRSGSVSVDARDYIEIGFDKDGEKQVLGPDKRPDPDIVHVLCVIGDQAGDDRFFIYTTAVISKLVTASYREYITQHGGHRPRNWCSTHSGYSPEALARAGCEANWGLIEQLLPVV